MGEVKRLEYGIEAKDRAVLYLLDIVDKIESGEFSLIEFSYEPMYSDSHKPLNFQPESYKFSITYNRGEHE